MVSEQIQNYVNLVGGLTRATKAKASEAAKGLLSAAGLDDVAAGANERVTSLAEEIIAASRANRELLLKMINTEVDKAAARIGFARAEDLEALRGEVAELRAALSEQSARAASSEAAATEATAAAAAAAPAAEQPVTSADQATATAGTRRAAVKKASVKQAATAPNPAAKKTPAKKTPAKKAPARKKAAARKAPEKTASKTATKPPTEAAAASKAPATPVEPA